ncbi:MAG: hypothetical protein PHX30_01400 [Candidatus Pacebacteria bacterium]|nr:hypothetical protein [Candidatus Paceibacterota bacterium]
MSKATSQGVLTELCKPDDSLTLLKESFEEFFLNTKSTIFVIPEFRYCEISGIYGV